MPHARRRLGDRGERIAEQFLLQRGYVVLERNYRCQTGEIDLVCRDGDSLAFVEVKIRRGAAFGAPEEAVDRRKMAHIEGACLQYLGDHDLPDQPWRVDVVAIQLDPSGTLIEVRLVANALDW
jgi:putative endonuclease